METGFQLAAREQYRYATIFGDGPWGVVVHCFCGKKIRLCPTEDEAKRLAASKCRATPCRDQHSVEHLTPMRLPQPVWDSIAERMGDE